jgi:hypothetical protein
MAGTRTETIVSGRRTAGRRRNGNGGKTPVGRRNRVQQTAPHPAAGRRADNRAVFAQARQRFPVDCLF